MHAPIHYLAASTDAIVAGIIVVALACYGMHKEWEARGFRWEVQSLKQQLSEAKAEVGRLERELARATGKEGD